MLKEIMRDCDKFWVASDDEKVIHVGSESVEDLFNECIMPDDERIIEGGYIGKLRGVEVYVGDFEYGYTVSSLDKNVKDKFNITIELSGNEDEVIKASNEVSKLLDSLDFENLV